jgi:hypothetical protein
VYFSYCYIASDVIDVGNNEYAILNCKLTLCINGRTDWDVIKFFGIAEKGVERKYVVERRNGMDWMKNFYCLVNKEVPLKLFADIRHEYLSRSGFYFDKKRLQPRSTKHPGDCSTEHEASAEAVDADKAKWTLYPGRTSSVSTANAPANYDLESRASRAAEKKRKLVEAVEEKKQVVKDQAQAKKRQRKEKEKKEAEKKEKQKEKEKERKEKEKDGEKKREEKKKKANEKKKAKPHQLPPPTPKTTRTTKQATSQSQMTPSLSPGIITPDFAGNTIPLAVQLSIQLQQNAATLQHNAALHAQKLAQDNQEYQTRIEREDHQRQVYKREQQENSKRKRDEEDREDLRRSLKQEEEKVTLARATAESNRVIAALRKSESLANDRDLREFESTQNYNERVRDAGLQESALQNEHRRRRENESDRRQR